MTQSEFPLPDVGEGLTEAEIVSWKVRPGDTVAINQVLVEIETAKSLVELPSPFAGTVTALLAAEGTTVEVGAPIIRVDSAKPHPKYLKIVRRSVRLHAHDEQNEANLGDVVKIVETRPLSKLKRWRLIEILERAK